MQFAQKFAQSPKFSNGPKFVQSVCPKFAESLAVRLKLQDRGPAKRHLEVNKSDAAMHTSFHLFSGH